MPRPSTSLATQRPDLATFTEFDLEMQRRGYIGNRVFPVMDIAKQSGTFGRIPLEQLLASAGDTRRSPMAGYSRGDWKFEPDSYATSEYGWEEPIDDREAEMYSDFFDAEQISTMRAYEQVLRAQEIRVANAVFNATTFSSQTTSVTNEWDDTASATPITDVETAVKAVANRTGIWPDTLVINRLVFRNLRNCQQIIDRINSAGAGQITRATDINEAQLAAVFDLPKIIVAGNYNNTANEGQDASLAQIWSNEYAMVAKTASTNDMREPCLGRILHWGGDGSSSEGRVESYRNEEIRADVIRVRHEVTEKVLYTEMGQLLDNITT